MQMAPSRSWRDFTSSSSPMTDFRTEPTFRLANLTSNTQPEARQYLAEDHFLLTSRTLEPFWVFQIFDHNFDLVYHYFTTSLTDSEQPYVRSKLSKKATPSGQGSSKLKGPFLIAGDVFKKQETNGGDTLKVYDSSYREVKDVRISALRRDAGLRPNVLSNDNTWVHELASEEAKEFDAITGEVLQQVHISPPLETTVHSINRGKWVGYPRWRPKMALESPRCHLTSRRRKESDNKLDIWISWNGATEVARWRVSGSHDALSLDWETLGTYSKTGFETHISIPNPQISRVHDPPVLAEHVYVQALDAKGGILRHGGEIMQICDPTDQSQGLGQILDSARETFTMQPRTFLIFILLGAWLLFRRWRTYVAKPEYPRRKSVDHWGWKT